MYGTQRRYWQETLAGDLPVLRLIGEPRPREAAAATGAAHAVIEPAIVGAARDLAGRRGVGSAVVLLAAYFATLYRYSRTDQIVVGTPTASWASCGELVALRAQLAPERPFTDLVDRVAALLAAALAHGDLPFGDVLTDLGRGAREVFRAAFLIRPAGAGPGERYLRPPDVDLSLVLGLAGDELCCDLEYAGDALGPAAARRVLDSYRTLLADATARPSARLDELLLLPPARHAEWATRANTGFARYQGLRPIHHPFADAAARDPEATAVECGGAATRYGELDRRANALAGRLAAAGIGTDDRVGVLVERSVELAVALLGVLKAGAAFVPLDTRAPAERLGIIAADAGLRMILTQDRFRGCLAGIPVAATVVPADGAAAVAPPVSASLDAAACVYYTSGSTGTPKGVVLDHRCVAGRLEWLARRYRLGPGQRVVHKTPLIFDVAIWEIFGPLAAGATVSMAQPDAESDVAHLGSLLAAERTVFTHFVPSMLSAYLDLAPARTYPDLRWVQLSGEAVPTRLLERFAAHFDAELHNLYGQTETSEVAGWEGRAHHGTDLVPMGRPLGIYRLFVLDDALRPVPPGVPGELCVAGVGGLARGYHGRPALTAERFVPHPYPIAPGERLYRTGDLAAIDDDGVLHYLGRVDDQTKIRGCRVEVGEVEAVLARYPRVTGCAVVARPDEAGDNQLIAYVAGGVPVADLAAHAERLLPGYMLPAVYVPLAGLPLGPSGKLDRRALPAPTAADRAARIGGDDPRSEVEAELSELWRTILGVERVGSTDDFFRIGGNSLKALRVLNRVNTTFGVEVTVRQFFAEPTVRRMAANVEQALTALVAQMSEEDAARLLGQMEE